MPDSMFYFVLQYGGSVGSQPSPPVTEPGPVPSSPSQEPPTKREYDQCRIQVLILIPVLLLEPLCLPIRYPAQSFFQLHSLCQISPFFVRDLKSYLFHSYERYQISPAPVIFKSIPPSYSAFIILLTMFSFGSLHSCFYNVEFILVFLYNLILSCERAGATC